MKSLSTPTRKVPAGLSLRLPLLKAAQTQTPTLPPSFWGRPEVVSVLSDPVLMGLLGAGGGGLLGLIIDSFQKKEERDPVEDMVMGALLGGLGGLGGSTIYNLRRGQPPLGAYTQVFARERNEPSAWIPTLIHTGVLGTLGYHTGPLLHSVARMWGPAYFRTAVHDLREQLARSLADHPEFLKRVMTHTQRSRSLMDLLREIVERPRRVGRLEIRGTPHSRFFPFLSYGSREEDVSAAVRDLVQEAKLRLVLNRNEARTVRIALARELARVLRDLELDPADATLQAQERRLRSQLHYLSPPGVGRQSYDLPLSAIPGETEALRGFLERSALDEIRKPQVHLAPEDIRIHPYRYRWDPRRVTRAQLEASPTVQHAARLNRPAMSQKVPILMELPKEYLPVLEDARRRATGRARWGRAAGMLPAALFFLHSLGRR